MCGWQEYTHTGGGVGGRPGTAHGRSYPYRPSSRHNIVTCVKHCNGGIFSKPNQDVFQNKPSVFVVLAVELDKYNLVLVPQHNQSATKTKS